MPPHVDKITLGELSFISQRHCTLLAQELNVNTVKDLLYHFPFRYEDRSSFTKVNEVIKMSEKSDVQILGKLTQFKMIGSDRSRRLVATFYDDTGGLEVTWFKGLSWLTSTYKENIPYILYGRLSFYRGAPKIVHPELELYHSQQQLNGKLQPIYSLTEKLRKNFVSSLVINRAISKIFKQNMCYIPDDLPAYMNNDLGLIPLSKALQWVHLPTSKKEAHQAIYRLKFAELFYNQYIIIKEGKNQKKKFKGFIFNKLHLVHQFYPQIPFPFTGAQKRVIKEFFKDMKSGTQMNRLLQGEVGSGKTIVAFICMLIAISNGTQVAFMAPTEVLAHQHYQSLSDYTSQLGLKIALLTGSTKAKERKTLHEALATGSLHILVGTHALLSEKVKYKALGLAIIDEQHKFGVAQRSKLWEKNEHIAPHILVMTATPIPRTLAMTVYGNLEVSIIDELPANRLPIITKLFYEKHRLAALGLVRNELRKGRQAYFIYPLIEESEKLDLLNLNAGYDAIADTFSGYQISIVHGRQKPADKAFEMNRFVKGETQIMVATTVIEVGVNVSNASIMVIEHAERFGLAQLHQLRGRVGRGSYQSYCCLMAGVKLSNESKQRLQTMVATNNGFIIAQKDMELRGPGNMSGTQQSGLIEFKIADLATDEKILTLARRVAQYIIKEDPELEQERHQAIKDKLNSDGQYKIDWSNIS